MNCEKHGRLIVATLDVDTEEEEQYCIGCIIELKENLKEQSKPRCDNGKCSYCDWLHDDEEDE